MQLQFPGTCGSDSRLPTMEIKLGDRAKTKARLRKLSFLLKVSYNFKNKNITLKCVKSLNRYSPAPSFYAGEFLASTTSRVIGVRFMQSKMRERNNAFNLFQQVILEQIIFELKLVTR